jgi:hypothetical protein
MAIRGKVQQPYQGTHPEIRKGEVYMGNVTQDAFKHRPWKTKRLGKQPIDVHGNPIPVKTLFPLFVNSSELTDAGLKEFRAA